MEVIISVPQHDSTVRPICFIIRPNDPVVEVQMRDAEGKGETKNVDVSVNIWPALSDTQKNIIRGVFKAVFAEAKGVDEETVTGDIW